MTKLRVLFFAIMVAGIFAYVWPKRGDVPRPQQPLETLSPAEPTPTPPARPAQRKAPRRDVTVHPTPIAPPVPHVRPSCWLPFYPPGCAPYDPNGPI